MILLHNGTILSRHKLNCQSCIYRLLFNITPMRENSLRLYFHLLHAYISTTVSRDKLYLNIYRRHKPSDSYLISEQIVPSKRKWCVDLKLTTTKILFKHVERPLEHDGLYLKHIGLIIQSCSRVHQLSTHHTRQY